MTARWTPRAIPLEPGNEDDPCIVVCTVETADGPMVDFGCQGTLHTHPPLLQPTVACQLGQALQDASAWCGAERARREARKR
jgi:hypothetical protein